MTNMVERMVRAKAKVSWATDHLATTNGRRVLDQIGSIITHQEIGEDHVLKIFLVTRFTTSSSKNVNSIFFDSWLTLWFLNNWSIFSIEKWTKVGAFHCVSGDWPDMRGSTLAECKNKCEGYNYMSYVERGDKNCACHMTCESRKTCGSPSRCDLYKAGKWSFFQF